jgi:hypothetical protein
MRLFDRRDHLKTGQRKWPGTKLFCGYSPAPAGSGSRQIRGKKSRPLSRARTYRCSKREIQEKLTSQNMPFNVILSA